MTNEDVMVQILHEVTGQPPEHFRQILKFSKMMSPKDTTALDEELPPAEAMRLLAALRAEKSGILNWILEGRRQALAMLAHPGKPHQ